MRNERNKTSQFAQLEHELSVGKDWVSPNIYPERYGNAIDMLLQLGFRPFGTHHWRWLFPHHNSTFTIEVYLDQGEVAARYNVVKVVTDLWNGNERGHTQLLFESDTCPLCTILVDYKALFKGKLYFSELRDSDFIQNSAVTIASKYRPPDGKYIVDVEFFPHIPLTFSDIVDLAARVALKLPFFAWRGRNDYESYKRDAETRGKTIYPAGQCVIFKDLMLVELRKRNLQQLAALKAFLRMKFPRHLVEPIMNHILTKRFKQSKDARQDDIKSTAQ